MNKDAQGCWKVGMSNIKLKMRAKYYVPGVFDLRKDLSQDFRFGPGTATVYIRAGPNARLFALTLHISSAGRRQGSSVRSQTLIARPERRCGRHYSLPNLFGAENC